MNFLFYANLMFIAFTYVICDQKSDDLKCLKDGEDSLQGKTDDEIHDLTQEQFVEDLDLVAKRVEIAAKDGLSCYKEFYDDYTGQMKELLLKPHEMELVNKAKDAKEKTDALKGIHGLSQLINCDEHWREGDHFVEALNAANCSKSEQGLLFLTVLGEFKAKLVLLETTMSATSIATKFQNKVMAEVMTGVLNIYKGVYARAETCALALTSPALKCKSIKMQTSELNRLFYLFGLQAQEQLTNLIQK